VVISDKTARLVEGCFTCQPLGAQELKGLAQPLQGHDEEGMAQARQGIAAWRATGASLYVPYFYTLLADVSVHLGRTAEGLQALAEAHILVEQHEERWWEAEIYRLRGVFLLRQPGTPQEGVYTEYV
jgi:predicted ATPase